MQENKKKRAFQTWTNRARQMTGIKGKSAKMYAYDCYPSIKSKTAKHIATARAKSLLLKNKEHQNLNHLKRGLQNNVKHSNIGCSSKQCVAGMFQITCRVLLAACICTMLTGTHDMHLRKIK